MAELIRGKLIWQKTKTGRERRVVYPTKKGTSQPTFFTPDQLDATLKSRTEDEIEVDLELDGGKPVRIRAAGEEWVVAVALPPRQEGGPRGGQPARRPGGGGADRAPGQRRGWEEPPRAQLPPAFHNPYNFIPALLRDRVTGDLGDGEPAGHHRYLPDRISGMIRVKLTTETPLLLPDAARGVEYAEDISDLGIQKGHKTFPVRDDADNKPYVPPTSVKGMLRAAYEAVTNSRLAVFPGHDRELALRMATQEGLRLVPARVEGGGLVLLMGTSAYGESGPVHAMYAAWLPRYFRGRVDRSALCYADGTLPQHGDAVQCWVELYEHSRWDRGRRSHVFDFRVWRVRKIVRRDQPLGACPLATRVSDPIDGRSYYKPLPDMQQIKGYTCVTNANIDRKHDERVFFTDKPNPPALALSDKDRRDWETLILNYQEEHAEEIRQGRKSPPALSHSEWSRQVVGCKGEARLDDGTLCYASVRQSGETWHLDGLFPVNISRRLHSVSPLDLVEDSLRPASLLNQLSPADRVFGWVSQDGQGACRGHLRVGPVTCARADAIEPLGDPGQPLSILGQPKPQQARFYVAAGPNGASQQSGRLTKEEVGYRQGKGLRGRKVYPHHQALPQTYWDEPAEDKTQRADTLRFQEYRRPRLKNQEQRDNQNRSIQGWVKPKTEFSFDLHVTNLTAVELGGLLWLLSLGEGHFHRLGGGKPLGFGSVRLTIDPEKTHLHTGDSWKVFYSTLDDTSPAEVDRNQLIDSFKEAVVGTYAVGTRGTPEERFQQVSFIAAFLRAARGFDDNLPIHYPRARQPGPGHGGPVPPHSEGKAYEWFVANDRTGRDAGPRACLPDLANDSGLPMLDAP